MKQVDIFAEAYVSGTKYQWLAYQDGDIIRIDMFQKADRWLRYQGLEERLHGGTVRQALDETVSNWLAYSAENGHSVRRTI